MSREVLIAQAKEEYRLLQRDWQQRRKGILSLQEQLGEITDRQKQADRCITALESVLIAYGVEVPEVDKVSSAIDTEA